MSPISLPRQLKKVSDRALLKSLESGLEIVEENLKQATSHADKIAGASARHRSHFGCSRHCRSAEKQADVGDRITDWRSSFRCHLFLG